VSEQDYYQLTPDKVLDAIESLGIQLDGTMLTMNSYENRVYRVAKDSGERIVAKFYRPNRWSDEQILEEHIFSTELNEAEIPVVAPLKIDGQSLFSYQSFRFSLFPCEGGRAPELDDPKQLVWLGRFIARIHNLGEVSDFQHRPILDVKSYGDDSIAQLLSSGHIPNGLIPAWQAIAEQVLEQSKKVIQSNGQDYQGFELIRSHADCHPGNVLWTDKGPHFVDFDDARMAPAIQDLWMLLGADDEQLMRHRFDALMDGYEEFRDFDTSEIQLIEPLRALRMLHYSAWLSRRYEDPSFQHHFPWFAENRYWEEQILALKEQSSAIHEPPFKAPKFGNC
jgi:Ser/Thr protein kinase RdoA (MazF antagonist)